MVTTSTTITSTSASLIFSTFLLLFLATSAPSPLHPRASCAVELVLFSPCLPYVAAAPNNLTQTANPQCCAVFSSAFESGAGTCICYLLRQPMILGFPLDIARVLSLSQVCTNRRLNGSLESLCSPSESPELPPLQNTPDTQITRPSDSGDEVATSSSSSSIGLSPESDKSSPDHFGFPREPVARLPPRSNSRAEPAQVSSEATPTCTRKYLFLPPFFISILLSLFT